MFDASIFPTVVPFHIIKGKLIDGKQRDNLAGDENSGTQF
jgi:hypothetical protein